MAKLSNKVNERSSSEEKNLNKVTVDEEVSEVTNTSSSSSTAPETDKEVGKGQEYDLSSLLELINSMKKELNELKGEQIKANKPTIVDINITAFIPDEWVGSTEQKMIEYKRLSDVKNETELNYIVTEWKDRFSRIPDEVENLIKLIQIRLAATECGVTIIREAGNDIRVYSPFTPYEWNIIKNGLDKIILRRVKFTVAPKTCEDGKSILLADIKNLSFDEIFNILSGLFYYIKETINKYQ